MAYRIGDTLAVRVSSYQQDGQTKFRYRNVGRILVSDDGREMITIDRTFNPAGVLPDGRDSVVVYRFQAREKEAARAPDAFPKGYQPSQEELDDIPF